MQCTMYLLKNKGTYFRYFSLINKTINNVVGRHVILKNICAKYMYQNFDSHWSFLFHRLVPIFFLVLGGLKIWTTLDDFII